jgi:ubiquinol-cytochrome c reductase cytochrome b subunit
VSLFSKVSDFLDDRTGYKKLVGHLLDEPVKGGARWGYVFGSTLLAVFAIQVVTGGGLMTSYAPSDKTAWASVHYITFKQAGGWLLRGIHHFGAQAMVILLGVHLLQVALFGAYKKPREVTWWIGLLLLTVVIGFALTGYLLPWDQKGYWATRVATNIAGTVPVVGESTQRLMVGGSEYGSLTLTRFYALHVFVLPASLALLAGAHVALFRKNGVTPAARADLTKTDPFHPHQLLKDIGASLVIVGIVIALAVKEHGAPLDAPADPSSDYPARPEWYFYSLFELLKWFHGPMEVVGTVVIPALVFAYLFALPFLDRKPSTALRPRIKPLVPLFLVGLNVVALTVQSMRTDAADANFQKERAKADERALAANRLAMDGIPPEGPLAMLKHEPMLRGPELFDKHCGGCHTLGTHGTEKDRIAPKLDGWGTEAWVLDMIHDPDADAKFGRTFYKGEMPSVDVPAKGAENFKPMADADKKAIAAFLSGKPDAKGKDIVSNRCTTCHLFEGKGDDSDEGLAPELSGWGTQAWIKAQIANPSSKATYREHALDKDRKGHMPRFDGEMSPEDLDLLATWLRRCAAEGRCVP